MQVHTIDKHGDPICAAGGIVWHGSEPLIAVVHRAAHKDCVLPKGKLEPGETARAAAIREVREETGYDVSVGEFVGAISYEANGHPKIVHFWRMEAGSQSRAPLEREVEKVEWLPPKGAIEKLTYSLERLLVEVADQKPRMPRRRRSWPRWPVRPVSSIARLRQSITSYRPELEQRIQDSAASGAIHNHWAKSTLMLLDRAKEAADENDADTGWRCFKAARRMELFGLDDDGHTIRATQLVAEGRQKLGGWRKEALLQILLSGEQLKSKLSPYELVEATRILHEGQNNEYRRLRIRRDQFIVLGFIALALLPTFIALLWMAGISLDVQHPWGILQIAVLGALGARHQRYSTDRESSGQRTYPRGVERLPDPAIPLGCWCGNGCFSGGAMAVRVSSAAECIANVTIRDRSGLRSRILRALCTERSRAVGLRWRELTKPGS